MRYSSGKRWDACLRGIPIMTIRSQRYLHVEPMSSQDVTSTTECSLWTTLILCLIAFLGNYICHVNPSISIRVSFLFNDRLELRGLLVKMCLPFGLLQHPMCDFIPRGLYLSCESECHTFSTTGLSWGICYWRENTFPNECGKVLCNVFKHEYIILYTVFL